MLIGDYSMENNKKKLTLTKSDSPIFHSCKLYDTVSASSKNEGAS